MSSILTTEARRASPHTHDNTSVSRIMLHVCLALVPATGFGFYSFGWPAFLLWATTCLTAVVTEAVCLLLQGKSPSQVRDTSALLTGWLLAMTLPPWAPWWIGAGGAAFAIAVGKQLYGGVGHNIFNPAMLARVALLVSFPVHMTTWILPVGLDTPDFLSSMQLVFMQTPMAEVMSSTDGITGATILGELKTVQTAGTVESFSASQFSLSDAFFGHTPGSLAETSELLVLAGGLWLLSLRIISWHIPVAMLGSLAIMSFVFHHGDSAHYANTLIHLTSGGIMLGAFFIATDYVTSPSSKTGQLLFGAGCGLIVFAIRSWGGFPEGVGFAVLFMNALTPLLDRYCRPRVYGRDLRGKPVNAKAKPGRVK